MLVSQSPERLRREGNLSAARGEQREETSEPPLEVRSRDPQLCSCQELAGDVGLAAQPVSLDQNLLLAFYHLNGGMIYMQQSPATESAKFDELW